MKGLLAFCAIGLLLIAGCAKDNASGSISQGFVCDSTVTYTNSTKAIIDANCSSTDCHGGAIPQGGIGLTNYNSCRGVAINGMLMCTIKHECGEKPMPYLLPKLNDSTIAILDCWVNNGAKQ